MILHVTLLYYHDEQQDKDILFCHALCHKLKNSMPTWVELS